MVKKYQDKIGNIQKSTDENSQDDDFESIKKEAKKHKNKKVKNLGQVMSGLLEDTADTNKVNYNK